MEYHMDESAANNAPAPAAVEVVPVVRVDAPRHLDEAVGFNTPQVETTGVVGELAVEVPLSVVEETVSEAPVAVVVGQTAPVAGQVVAPVVDANAAHFTEEEAGTISQPGAIDNDAAPVAIVVGQTAPVVGQTAPVVGQVAAPVVDANAAHFTAEEAGTISAPGAIDNPNESPVAVVVGQTVAPVVQAEVIPPAIHFTAEEAGSPAISPEEMKAAEDEGIVIPSVKGDNEAPVAVVVGQTPVGQTAAPLVQNTAPIIDVNAAHFTAEESDSPAISAADIQSANEAGTVLNTEPQVFISEVAPTVYAEPQIFNTTLVEGSQDESPVAVVLGQTVSEIDASKSVTFTEAEAGSAAQSPADIKGENEAQTNLDELGNVVGAATVTAPIEAQSAEQKTLEAVFTEDQQSHRGQSGVFAHIDGAGSFETPEPEVVSEPIAEIHDNVEAATASLHLPEGDIDHSFEVEAVSVNTGVVTDGPIIEQSFEVEAVNIPDVSGSEIQIEAVPENSVSIETPTPEMEVAVAKVLDTEINPESVQVQTAGSKDIPDDAVIIGVGSAGMSAANLGSNSVMSPAEVETRTRLRRGEEWQREGNNKPMTDAQKEKQRKKMAKASKKRNRK